MAPSIVVLVPALAFCASVVSAQATAPTPLDPDTRREPAVTPQLACVEAIGEDRGARIRRFQWETTLPAAPTQASPGFEQFMTAVNEYVELHRLLENPLARLTCGADPEQAARARRAHRSLIREARALAERPKIFTPCVSEYLREQIRRIVSTVPPDREHWAPAVLDRLPQLPIELGYRFEERISC
jgi:hypothetical protein